MSGTFEPALRSWVESHVGAVAGAEPIGSGASRQIWLVDLASGEQVVVRLDSGDGPVAHTALTLAREADVYRALAPTPLPIPSLRAVHPDGTALLVDRASGVDSVDGLGDEERRSVAGDYGRCLAQLHLLDPAELELGALGLPAGTDPTTADLELWRSIDATRIGDRSSPSTQVALERLAASVPSTPRTALCHGDAGPGNFLHEGGRVTAMLDWEFAHLGDPQDDLAWVAVRNQLLGHPLDLATCFTAWQDATATPLDVRRIEWFRALVLTRMLISCEAMLAWAGADAPNAMVHATLQPFLALAVFEALRRGGCDDASAAPHEAAARGAWEPSLIASLLGDPTDLDDLGAFS